MLINGGTGDKGSSLRASRGCGENRLRYDGRGKPLPCGLPAGAMRPLSVSFTDSLPAQGAVGLYDENEGYDEGQKVGKRHGINDPVEPEE